MLSSGLKNPNIGKKLHLHPALMVWGYFPETLTDLPEKTFQGGIITSLHKISSHESKFDVQTVIETPTLGPASFGVLLPWVSGHDTKKRLLKYLRTAHLFALVKDQGSGEVKQEGRISYKLDPSDKENLKMGMRRALQILVTAGATEDQSLMEIFGTSTVLHIRWGAVEWARRKKMVRLMRTVRVGELILKAKDGAVALRRGIT
ncbi:hypothetical protein GIB67_035841 [Kingdonia uniflora]|uniref:Uncharacterized protein n=1 Tax=Kingdonia uniflora TaxID=39325 RepID=A0A7J7MJX6_9MAGN|nr:hypothetical protein GIB67_035841 [Kingdonia uniflora]